MDSLKAQLESARKARENHAHKPKRVSSRVCACARVPCVCARVCAHVQQYVYVCLVLYMCVCFYVYVIVFLLSGVCAGGGGAGSGLVQNGPIGTSVASERPLTARGAERREEEEESGKSETHTLVFIVT